MHRPAHTVTKLNQGCGSAFKYLSYSTNTRHIFKNLSYSFKYLSYFQIPVVLSNTCRILFKYLSYSQIPVVFFPFPIYCEESMLR